MIRNADRLAENHGGKPARIVLDALDYALRQVDPSALVSRAVRLEENSIGIKGIKGERFDLLAAERVYVVGAGKASARMAEALCSILGRRIERGAITIPYDDFQDDATPLPASVEVTEAAHPIPDEAGVEGTKKIIDILAKAGQGDVIFVLLSGGGSALLPLPAPNLDLSDKQRLTSKLLKSGATIQEVNVVRKHLSSIKGGQLVRYARKARVVSLILSDVIDDDVSSIASGPTCPDPSTFLDAHKIVRKYGITTTKDRAVEHIIKGSTGALQDTPKAGDPVFRNVHNVLIGNNEIACASAMRHLRRKGIKTSYLGSRFNGEATDYGVFLARLARDLNASGRAQYALVLGGETTVTIKGRAGTGGRNQQAGLSCARRLPSETLVACMGTDGIDGNSDAAGALVSGSTLKRAKLKRLDLALHLKRHDSYSALKATGSLIFTGRTGTNVNDVTIVYSAR